jgi:phytoene synthase
VARACDLGVAMQLTNIARDVGEDARAGRIYLPLSWLSEFEVNAAEFVAAPRFSPEIAAATKRLLEVARAFYERGLAGLDFLPANCRPGIVAAAGIYADIGEEIARHGYDSVTRRAVVPASRKLARLIEAVAGLNFACRSPLGAPLPANAFLVDAVDLSHGAARSRAGGENVLDLFLRLERRDRDGAGTAPA